MTVGGGYLLGVYGVYIVASVALTIWLARTLFRNGAVFLDDVFQGRPGLAAALNRLLVTGFYMASLGYAFLILRSDPPANAMTAVETLVTKLGLLLVSLALLHFANLLVFNRLRRRAVVPHGSAAAASAGPAPTGLPPTPGQSSGPQVPGW